MNTSVRFSTVGKLLIGLVSLTLESGKIYSFFYRHQNICTSLKIGLVTHIAKFFVFYTQRLPMYTFKCKTLCLIMNFNFLLFICLISIFLLFRNNTENITRVLPRMGL